MNTIHTASDLAHSQSELETAQTDAEKTSAALSALETRISEKQQALNIIQQRRIEGGDCDSDAPTVALLALDIEGLQPLIETARVQYQTAVEAHQQALILLQQAQVAHEKATAETAAQALEARLRELETLLITGIQQLHVLKKVATGSIHIHGATLFNINPRITRFLATGVLQ